MKHALLAIILQLFWYGTVTLSHPLNHGYFFLGAFLIAMAYLLLSQQIQYWRSFFVGLTCFIMLGLFFDGALGFFNLAVFKNNTYHLGYLSLWVAFYCYYPQLFLSFRRYKASYNFFIGGIAGAFTYWAAQRLGAITPVIAFNFYCFVFFYWGIFFAMTVRLFSGFDWAQRMLDQTILFSFDRTGFQRHQTEFDKNFASIEEGSSFLITGGTSGIGLACVRHLYQKGMNVYFTGRDAKKGQAISDQCTQAHFLNFDTSDWQQFDMYIEKLPILSGVLLNAGGMPGDYKTNYCGIEYQAASQLIGHYILIKKLLLANKLKAGCKIVWMSSGGMYLKKMDLDNLLQQKHYDPVSTYANVKRCQVTLSQRMAMDPLWKAYSVYSMHPGWVLTPALQRGLPQFTKLMYKILRKPEEGADTAIWLLLSQNILPIGFYFDRKKQNEHFFAKTKVLDREINRLYDICEGFLKKL